MVPHASKVKPTFPFNKAPLRAPTSVIANTGTNSTVEFFAPQAIRKQTIEQPSATRPGFAEGVDLPASIRKRRLAPVHIPARRVPVLTARKVELKPGKPRVTMAANAEAPKLQAIALASE
jgi:hypothetical protein